MRDGLITSHVEKLLLVEGWRNHIFLLEVGEQRVNIIPIYKLFKEVFRIRPTRFVGGNKLCLRKRLSNGCILLYAAEGLAEVVTFLTGLCLCGLCLNLNFVFTRVHIEESRCQQRLDNLEEQEMRALLILVDLLSAQLLSPLLELGPALLLKAQEDTVLVVLATDGEFEKFSQIMLTIFNSKSLLDFL